MSKTKPSPLSYPTVYRILCSVDPHYLPDQSSPEQGHYAFSYTVTITNAGRVAAQLIARHWVIQDATGHTEEVKGLGVVGQQPLLQPGESFRYTSGTRQRTPTGTMRGSYFFVAEDGERFEADVPAFALDSGAGVSGRTLH